MSVSKEDINNMLEQYKTYFNNQVDVFYMFGTKTESTDLENPDVLFYGYSESLHRDHLIVSMKVITERFKNILSKESFEKLDYNIRHTLHHDFDPSEYVLCGGIKSIDIDMKTISREDYDNFHSLKDENNNKVIFVELQ